MLMITTIFIHIYSYFVAFIRNLDFATHASEGEKGAQLDHHGHPYLLLSIKNHSR
jgi:hypothetical protein